MNVVACVLRSGGDYGPEWVARLYAALIAHTPRCWDEWVFRALSDDAAVPGYVPLEHGFPNWWSKLELFRPDVFPRGSLVLYVDLDTLVVGDLAPFFEYAGELAMLSDFNASGRAQSGVMLFRPGTITAAIWDTFVAAPEHHIRRYRGDGEFLHAHTKADRLQDLFPGTIVSFKKHCRKAPPGGDVRLVCGHGRPRFSDRAAGWAHRAWKDGTEPREAV